jgi:hypothetical protein
VGNLSGGGWAPARFAKNCKGLLQQVRGYPIFAHNRILFLTQGFANKLKPAFCYVANSENQGIVSVAGLTNSFEPSGLQSVFDYCWKLRVNDVRAVWKATRSIADCLGHSFYLSFINSYGDLGGLNASLPSRVHRFKNMRRTRSNRAPRKLGIKL